MSDVDVVLSNPPRVTRAFSRSSSPVVNTVTLSGLGLLRGEVWNLDGSPVVRFLNVPYAAPPVGRLRWRPPQPPEPWQGERCNPALMTMCPQPDCGLLTGRFQGRRVEESEDCLVLNVFAPAPPSAEEGRPPSPRAPCPVVFYIHGGAGKYGTCHTDETAGDALAAKGIVYVSINYRLGVFGFLAHPALSLEDDDDQAAAAAADATAAGAAGADAGATERATFGDGDARGGADARASGAAGGPRGCGNYAILDQIAALRWVQKHIASFGGDPNNVTIWGLSSGAQFVSTLLVCPHADGLFHRAFVQSCCDLGNVRKLTSTTDVWMGRTAEEWGEAFGAALGCEAAEEDDDEEEEKGARAGGEGAQGVGATVAPSAKGGGASEEQPAADELPESPEGPWCDTGAPAASSARAAVSSPPTAQARRASGRGARRSERERAQLAQLHGMRALSTKKLVAASLLDESIECYESAADPSRAGRGALKPEGSLVALDRGHFRRVPLIVGYTSEDGLGAEELEQIQFDESKIKDHAALHALFWREFGERASDADEFFCREAPHSAAAAAGGGRKRSVSEALGAFSRDVWYDAATWHMANQVAAARDPPPVYVYRFAEKVPMQAVPCEPLCAWHGCDTTYWNGEEPIRPPQCAACRHPRPASTPLGQTMFGYLCHFARTGDRRRGLPAGAARPQQARPAHGALGAEHLDARARGARARPPGVRLARVFPGGSIRLQRGEPRRASPLAGGAGAGGGESPRPPTRNASLERLASSGSLSSLG